MKIRTALAAFALATLPAAVFAQTPAPQPAKPVRMHKPAAGPAAAPATAPTAAPVAASAPAASTAAAAPTAAKPRSAAQLAQGARMKACGAEWQGMKTSGKTAGKTWRQFSSECLKRKG